MRIVYILTSLRVGGAERQTTALAERMAARGHAVAVVALRGRAAEECPTTLPVVYLNMRKTPASFIGALLRARRFVSQFRPDVLHSHMFHANIFVRLLGLVTPALCIVSTVHNIYEGRPLRMAVYRLTDGLSRCTVFVSQAAATRYLRIRAVSPRKCKVVTNGIDTGAFAPDSQRRCGVRAKFQAGRSFVWLAAGRMVAAKNYPCLLRAFAVVLASRSDTRLWIAGEPWGRESARLRHLAAQLHVEQAIGWLGLRRDLPALQDAADGFVLSSAWEGLPLALAEAMAMEKTVVATDVGGVRELVADAGLIVPPGQPEALAATMLQLMDASPEQRHAMGRAARQRIQTGFNIESKAGEWESLYDALVSQDAPPESE